MTVLVLSHRLVRGTAIDERQQLSQVIGEHLEIDGLVAVMEPVQEDGDDVNAPPRAVIHTIRQQMLKSNDEPNVALSDYVAPLDMLTELRDDSKQLAAHLRETHALCAQQGDVASASLLEIWIDEAETRTWFLFEASR